MAAVSDATVIIEASDTSGTLHQAAECVNLGRLAFHSEVRRRRQKSDMAREVFELAEGSRSFVTG